ncbi:hypothetical protein BS50DRAFT_572764 [Corynespora cassiicola Philippines]|uniref:U4/U6 snRNA-associated-splicing factor PRP24 n=1 Tax=Corynespora cassiicola Philippines TaxID=1448308 RepID=A0A2T2NRN0_CORCC|nr:hypothetical protein BS50DRAFT_572764 [Corynespora cassiicola Philippines]
MDINSLLSPQDSPARETPPPTQPALPSPSMLHSPGKRAIRQMPSRTPSGLSQQITSSPQPQPPPQSQSQPQPHHPHAAYPQHQQHQQQHPHTHTHTQHAPHPQQQLPSPGVNNFANTNGSRNIHSATSTPPIDRQSLGSPHDARMTPPHPMHRQASTPGMDTLADLATMQHQQQAARQSYSAQRPSISLQNIPRTLSGSSATEIAMAEPSPKPRVFATLALDQQHIDYLYQLDKSLAEDPFNYYTHVSFVTILHQGMENHRTSIDPSNPRTYELLPFLREAYETLANKYPLGEVLWSYRIADEKALAQNIEDRLGVLELYKKAVSSEPYSAKLWQSNGEYITSLFACAYDHNAPEQWSEEERQFGRELFTPQLILDTWQQGADKVKYNIADSSLVWDRYLQFLEEDLERSPSKDKIAGVTKIYSDRLGQPHATWANTLSSYASFTQRYNMGSYEEAMEQAVHRNSHIKEQYSIREEFEFKLLQAAQQGNRDAEHHALTRYLKWEKKTMGIYSFHLVNALYERATLRFPVDSILWEDHIEFLIWQNDRSVDMLNVLERATLHCPWSGILWSHRILTLEEQQKGFDEIERVKHTATGTGMLEHTALEELIKVQIAWCGYLRRKAFDDPKASEDDADIAEVGIRSALELVNETGMKKYGRDWKGDPSYRLERIHIKFWLQRGNVEEARRIWDSLVPQQQDSYDFWYRYYIWEMVVWAHHAIRDSSNSGQPLNTPSMATAVLEQGMKQLNTIDQPEPIIDMFTNHCEQHESVQRVRLAAIERRRAERIVAIRRDKERAQAEETAAQATHGYPVEGSGKRKRADAVENDVAPKKSKQDDAEISPTPAAEAMTEPMRMVSEAPTDISTTHTRDREHSSIFVYDLPSDVTQTRIRQFFTDAGNVRDITLQSKKDKVTAHVEFETPEEAEYALTKQAKGFDGHDIVISRGEKSTLYVANYIKTADEEYIRKLFSPFGRILEVRFPSLKYKTNRRFAYVQFESAQYAQQATALDGNEIDGLRIVAKISDPAAKKKREEATTAGREVFVRYLNFKAKKHEVEEVFRPFGPIEHINMKTLPDGKNKGFAFVTFQDKEDANKAVAEMDGKDFWGLQLKVELAKSKAETKPGHKTTIVKDDASIPSRESKPEDGVESAEASGVAPPVRERSVAMLGVPDTIPAARIDELVKPYGLKRLTHMPANGGAILEFTTVEAVGKVELELTGKEIAPGKKIRFGTVEELKKAKAEYRPSSHLIAPTRINRPTAPARGGARGRGRGRGGIGLGHRPAGAKASAEASSNGDKSNSNADKPKNNADFREMLLSKKEDKDQKQDTADKMEE